MLALLYMVIVGEGGGGSGFSVKIFLMYIIFIPLGSHWFAPAEPSVLYEYGSTICPSWGLYKGLPQTPTVTETAFAQDVSS